MVFSPAQAPKQLIILGSEDGFHQQKSKTFYKPLFGMTLSEFIGALISFAGINSITITADPYKKYIDSNPEDNSATIEAGYADIFPKLSFLERIFGG